MRALLEQLLDPQVLTMLFAAIAAGATVLTLAMPLLATDTLDKRMKAVALERDKIRQRERERMALGSRASLRQSPKAYMKRVVDDFNLNKWLGQEHAQQGHPGPLAAGEGGGVPPLQPGEPRLGERRGHTRAPLGA